ncbi:hypothetical protein Nepgr_000234 [Nepenthes gracilis]|uniref:Uncharacterized protein n=1 Tax=Nepenthes gracilis TaxID=150966 RepID=A0AAD3P1L9_NEPGR|nr:hypothetical protein Nepgr_000234 [Nepenthes gracilis]
MAFNLLPQMMIKESTSRQQCLKMVENGARFINVGSDQTRREGFTTQHIINVDNYHYVFSSAADEVNQQHTQIRSLVHTEEGGGYWKNTDNGGVGLCRDYALACGDMWLQALKWQRDSRLASKHTEVNLLEAKIRKQMVAEVFLLSISWGFMDLLPLKCHPSELVFRSITFETRSVSLMLHLDL